MNTNENPALNMGVICRKERSSFLVLTGEKILSCYASAPWNGSAVQSENPSVAGRRSGKTRKGRPAPTAPAVGDRVLVESTSRDSGRIAGVLPRRNRISRRWSGSSRGRAVEQILAANIDQVLAFCAVDHSPPEWNLLDRFLALAEACSLPAFLVFSKSDLLPEDGPALEEIHKEIGEFRRIGYYAIVSSARTLQGIEEVRSFLRNKTTILLGKSGSGKTSLLNALHPDWDLRTGAINRFGEGRCTTSAAELFPLECGGAVVDTPGVRIFDLWGVEDLPPALLFREMRPWVGKCRFGVDCRHTEEPGCAVRRAVENGEVGARRFRNMLRLSGERP